MSLFEGATPGSFPALRSLPWREDYAGALKGARDVLLALDEPQFALHSWMAERTPDEKNTIVSRSADKATHCKWMLGGEPDLYSVVLHRYKEPDVFDGSGSFANSVHNHRYGFTSIVLSGELHTLDFDVEAPCDRADAARTARAMTPGDTMIVMPEDVHRVDRVGKKTQTLLIQGPIVRNYSIRYRADGSTERIYDLPTLIETLAFDIL